MKLSRAGWSMVSACACVLAFAWSADGQTGGAKAGTAVQQAAVTPPASARTGAEIFAVTCASCHQANGEGVPDRYPPLAGSDWVSGDADRMLRIVLHGLTGEVEVEGEMFSGLMPAWGANLKDPQVAAVVTYVRDRFGKGASPVTVADVARVRKATASRKDPYTPKEVSSPDSKRP